uniref:TGF-beta family profile domain-containing protein n=1 Tax=Trichobilharzia regenti TaxID=157069 RepID=A0AA85JI72_TRIRE|nr:unnamed protein product [Trichobilharzia regenti]
MRPYAMETERTKLYNLTPSTVIFLKTSNLSRLSLEDFFSIRKTISAYKFNEFFDNVLEKFLQVKYSVEKIGSYQCTSSIRKSQLLKWTCKLICVSLNKTTLLIIFNNAVNKLKFFPIYLHLLIQYLFYTYYTSYNTYKLQHLIHTNNDDGNNVCIESEQFIEPSVIQVKKRRPLKYHSSAHCTNGTLIEKRYDRAANKPCKGTFSVYLTWITIVSFLYLFKIGSTEAVKQSQESSSSPNQYNLVNLLHSLSSIGKQINAEILTKSELRTWNYLLEKIIKSQTDLLRDQNRLDYTPILTPGSSFNSISNEFFKYDKTTPKPSKAELMAKTPSYMFKLHERHMNDWHSFGRYEENHLVHPDYEKYLSENQFSTSDNHQGEKTKRKEHHGRHHLGMITAIRHHRHIETHEHVNSETDMLLSRRKRSAEPNDAHLSADNIVKRHKLVFQLADIPSNEHLIAASIRIRYEAKVYSENYSIPTVSSSFCSNITNNDKMRSTSFYWPLSLWLHSDQNNSSNMDIQTAAIFEPDDLQCKTQSTKNSSLINLPNGWFHIPLNQPVLHLIEKINQQTYGDKQIVIQIRSVIQKGSPMLGDLNYIIDNNSDEQLDYLRVNNVYQNRQNSFSSSKWLHNAPHLFTYHRDPNLAEYIKRKARSADYSNGEHTLQTDEFNHINVKPETQNVNNKKIARRYKRLQRLLNTRLSQQKSDKGTGKSGQHDEKTYAKTRSRRRAQYRQHHNRPRQDHYYYTDIDSVNEHEDISSNLQMTSNSYEDNRKTDRYKQKHYQYDTGRSYHSNILQTSNHHYLDTTCQRRELIINFDAVGWAGWVIAPQAYNARYCLGQCPFPLSTHYNTTNHAVLLQLVHLLDVARIPGPCCVPHQLSSQSLLYHSQNGDVVLRVYEDMVVESCACR